MESFAILLLLAFLLISSLWLIVNNSKAFIELLSDQTAKQKLEPPHFLIISLLLLGILVLVVSVILYRGFV